MDNSQGSELSSSTYSEKYQRNQYRGQEGDGPPHFPILHRRKRDHPNNHNEDNNNNDNDNPLSFDETRTDISSRVDGGSGTLASTSIGTTSRSYERRQQPLSPTYMPYRPMDLHAHYQSQLKHMSQKLYQVLRVGQGDDGDMSYTDTLESGTFATRTIYDDDDDLATSTFNQSYVPREDRTYEEDDNTFTTRQPIEQGEEVVYEDVVDDHHHREPTCIRIHGSLLDTDEEPHDYSAPQEAEHINGDDRSSQKRHHNISVQGSSEQAQFDEQEQEGKLEKLHGQEEDKRYKQLQLLESYQQGEEAEQDIFAQLDRLGSTHDSADETYDGTVNLPPLITNPTDISEIQRPMQMISVKSDVSRPRSQGSNRSQPHHLQGTNFVQSSLSHTTALRAASVGESADAMPVLRSCSQRSETSQKQQQLQQQQEQAQPPQQKEQPQSQEKPQPQQQQEQPLPQPQPIYCGIPEGSSEVCDFAIATPAPSSAHSSLSWRSDPNQSFSDWTIRVIVAPKLKDDTDASSASGSTKKDDGSSISATYHCHSNVLAWGPRKSMKMAQMIQKRNVADDPHTVTPLEVETELEAQAFPLLLDYMYCAAKLPLKIDQACALYLLATDLQIAPLQKTISSYIESALTFRQMMELLIFAHTMETKRLQKLMFFCHSKLCAYLTRDPRAAKYVPPYIMGQVLETRYKCTQVLRKQQPEKFVAGSNAEASRSLTMSKVVAACCSSKKHDESTIGGEVTCLLLEQMCHIKHLPMIDPQAALQLLVADGKARRREPPPLNNMTDANDRSGSSQSNSSSSRMEGQMELSCFQRRCLAAFKQDWHQQVESCIMAKGDVKELLEKLRQQLSCCAPAVLTELLLDFSMAHEDDIFAQSQQINELERSKRVQAHAIRELERAKEEQAHKIQQLERSIEKYEESARQHEQRQAQQQQKQRQERTDYVSTASLASGTSRRARAPVMPETPKERKRSPSKLSRR